MKNTGIVRKIDELGRIVLPKELRKTLNINSGDDFQITIDGEKIVLEKYSRLESFEESINNIINCFSSVTNYNVYVTINDKIINYDNKIISKVISNIILERKIYINDKVEKNIISEDIIESGKIVILPIVINSDLLGSIILIGNDSIDNIINIAKIINNIIKKMLLFN